MGVTYRIDRKIDGTWLVITGGRYTAAICLEHASKSAMVQNAVKELRESLPEPAETT